MSDADKGIRLHKLMARAGIASRRACERLIEQGRVRVNGLAVRTPGVCVRPEQDIVEVEGRRLSWSQRPPRQVWALYKPRFCMTTLEDPQGRPTIRQLFPAGAGRLFPVGRLDYDAEGLILVTNDGDFAQRVAHPSFMVPRVYLVKVRGLPSPSELVSLRTGAGVRGRRKLPAQVRILHTIHDKTWLEVKVREGPHHHIKEMFADLGHRVLKIKRYRIGPVELADMRPGQLRRLSRAEMAALAPEHAPPGPLAPRDPRPGRGARPARMSRRPVPVG